MHLNSNAGTRRSAASGSASSRVSVAAASALLALVLVAGAGCGWASFETGCVFEGSVGQQITPNAPVCKPLKYGPPV